MTPCREWQGARNTPEGYGKRWHKEKSATGYVHRQIIEMAGEDQFGTPWDPSLHVMHLCDNPPCFRYDHLRLGTHADNVRDCVAKGRFRNSNTPKTHCLRGHPFDETNTYIDPSGRRKCRTCHRERQRRRYQSQRKETNP